MLKILMNKKIIILVVVVVIVVSGYFVFGRGDKIEYEFTDVKKGDVVQTVSVTGQVKPAEDIKLAFETIGKITKVNIKVGDKVKEKDVLAALDSSGLNAQLSQAVAAVQAAEAKLAELEVGTRPEEIQVAEVAVSNARKSLDDAEKNLENVRTKADADLRSAYDSALASASKSVTVALNSLFVLTDIQFAHFLGYDQESIGVENAKAQAILQLLGASGAGRYTKEQINVLQGGARQAVQGAQANPSFENIDNALNQVSQALSAAKSALDSVPVSTSLTSTELTNLNAEKSNINTESITVSGKQQAIAVQKSTNQSSISTAEASVTTAQNTLANAEANLLLKKSGFSKEQIDSQKAQVKQAEANVQNIRAQLSKTAIVAPTQGTITEVNIKKGEIASANSVAITMINSGKFQIEANVSETEIAKLKLGNEVEITLDAFGLEEKFPGRIVKIDPAETIVSGVIYYKITSIFDVEDERVKSGMTANLDIQTDKRENALYLPYYVIKKKNGDKYVQILNDKVAVEKKIETGLEGETMVEIVGGLAEGEQVVIEK